jgi:RNA polymerase sigma-70 factor, ECF subfamily
MTSRQQGQRLSSVRARLSSLSDSELMRAYNQGEPRAFEIIVERYEGQLRAYATKRLDDWQLACDVTQDTFVRVIRHATRFDYSKKFSSWIYTIVSNLVNNELRNATRRRTTSFSSLSKDDNREWDCPDPSPGPEARLEQLHLELVVAEGIDRLPDKQRTVFRLRELEDRTYDEVAEIVGCKLGTVKSRLNRARRALKAKLKSRV